jgi:hypothetical protein
VRVAIVGLAGSLLIKRSSPRVTAADRQFAGLQIKEQPPHALDVPLAPLG